MVELETILKNVEEERDGGKGYSVHKTTVVSDTLGNPLKDTRGSSPNFFIKLISMTSIIMAGLIVVFSLF